VAGREVKPKRLSIAYPIGGEDDDDHDRGGEGAAAPSERPVLRRAAARVEAWVNEHHRRGEDPIPPRPWRANYCLCNYYPDGGFRVAPAPPTGGFVCA
jgi:hypothetical protein